ncbi:MAG: multicopper oxidase domain-containing protein [Longimicrobiales bacterium]
MRLASRIGLAVLLVAACGRGGDASDEWRFRTTSGSALPLALLNDNQTPSGKLRGGVLELELEARLARWEGEANLDADGVEQSVVTVLAFGEEGGPTTIPGPLIRVEQGAEVRIRIRNSIPDSVSIGLPPPVFREPGMSSVSGSTLIVHGLRPGAAQNDTLHVRQGEVREIAYRADKPGTYLYRASASPRRMQAWSGRDAQLAGAIVIDPAGMKPNPEERVFVITMLDQYVDPDGPPGQDEMVRRAINGRSWPDTERFRYAVGDTVRWRWVNASFESHPMHLHGFHYRVLSKGDGATDTIYARAARRLAVTEHMKPGSTFTMDWVPTVDGNWIFHCHILDHIVPAIERDQTARSNDMHDVEQHALDAMAGLVLGMTVGPVGSTARQDTPHRRLRILAQERSIGDRTHRRGFVLVDGAEPPLDSIAVPSPPLLLTRGETTVITVVNRLSEPTTIHWHGLELESVFDGVAGWSRTDTRVAPLIAPGDSFAVRITPPRAGTFIYHTHMDETDQLAQGMIGPIIVLEPGERFDGERDRIFLIGGQQEGDYPVNINGRVDPSPAVFRAGAEYRLRFVHITRGFTLDLELAQDSVPVRWKAVAKDGADLPPPLQIEAPARLQTNTGETYDFLWIPTQPGDARLTVRYDRFFVRERVELKQIFRVR